MKLSIGLTGAGGFSEFSVEAFLLNKQISLEAVYDKDPQRARILAEKHQAKTYGSLPEMLGDQRINMIYIATPPYLHYAQSKEALLAGRHVICEKPAATDPMQARELYELARDKGLLYVVNLMQPYNPLYRQVKEIIDEKLLGEFLHGFFENYASDENQGPEHWMWNAEKSGGIFIEHAVHFFDMFEGWLGKGKHVSSQKVRRQGYKQDIFSRVQSVGLYRKGLVNMYHGFDQPGRMDRQEIRLLFEKGDITLYEWIPVRANIQALVTKEQQERLTEIFPGADVKLLEKYTGEEKKCRGNFREYEIDSKILLEYGKKENKENVYRMILKEMIADQMKWIQDRSHKRVISGLNGVNSLEMAFEAEQKAQILE